MKKIDEKFYNMRFKLAVEDEPADSLEDLQRRLRHYREEFKDFPVHTESYRTAQALIIATENEIRKYYGLDPLPVPLSDADLEVLMDLGDKAVQEFLQKEPHSSRNDYQIRINEIQANRNLLRERKLRDNSFYNSAESDLKVLEDNKPQETIRVDGKIAINPVYNEWLDRVRALRDRISPRVKSAESYKAGEGSSPDHRERIFNLERRVNKLLEDEE